MDRAAKLKEIERLRKIEEIKRLRAEASQGAAPSEVPPAEEPSTLSKIGSAIADVAGGVGKKALSAAEMLTAPFTELDKMSGAPLRAGVGALQDGADLSVAGDALLEQLKAGAPKIGDQGPQRGELLPTTPTDTDIASKAILQAGIHPEFAKTMAPIYGVGVGAALDATNLIPSNAMQKGAKAVGAGVGALAGKAAKLAGKAEYGAARAITSVGQVLTSGHLDADDAMKAYRELNTRELLFPGGPMEEQGRLLGGLRQAFQSKQITVPGSHEVATGVQELLTKEAGRIIPSKAKSAKELIEQIEQMAYETVQVVEPAKIVDQVDQFGAVVKVEVPAQVREVTRPRDMSIDELDDVIRNFQFVTYTDAGFDRQLNSIWKPALKRARATLDEALQTVPEGALFKQEKSRFESLATAGKERGKLFEGIGKVGKAAAILSLEPASLALASLQPSTYIQALAVLKAPRSMAEPLMAALQSGRPAIIRHQLLELAERYPRDTERLIRATALLSGKPDGLQTLTPEEAETLTSVRIFDPVQVQAERERIKNDDTMSSVQKAATLSKINRNGYVTLPPPVTTNVELRESPPQLEEGGVEKLMELLRSH